MALAATLCLALVVGGAIFYAEIIAWDTLVVDYLLFALLSGVVLVAHCRQRKPAPKRKANGWPIAIKAGPVRKTWQCLR